VAGAGNDFQKDKQFKKLNAVKDTIEVKVIRAGNEVLVSNLDIVVGDLLVLDTGDKIVADGLAVESFGLVVDEACLTGESEPLAKGPREDPWCRSGTQVPHLPLLYLGVVFKDQLGGCNCKGGGCDWSGREK
jgi:Ca2+-transporting ATPase